MPSNLFNPKFSYINKNDVKGPFLVFKAKTRFLNHKKKLKKKISHLLILFCSIIKIYKSIYGLNFKDFNCNLNFHSI